MEVASRSDDQEFLPSVAADHVIRPQHRRNALHNCYQRGISGPVSIVVVDLLEVVHIGNDHAQRVVFAATACEFAAQDVANGTPVQNSGQRVMLRMKA